MTKALSCLAYGPVLPPSRVGDVDEGVKGHMALYLAGTSPELTVEMPLCMTISYLYATVTLKNMVLFSGFV